MIKRYPLSWPAGWKRTEERKAARFRRGTHRMGRWSERRELSISEATERVFQEFRTMKIEEVVISTNLVLTSFGTPRSEQKEPRDPGVAVYWYRNRKPQCMAIDLYDRVADNLAAIAASLTAMRTLERHGGIQVMERAFQGFAALPERVGRSWREVLVFPDGYNPTTEQIESSFRKLAKDVHPDKQNGSHAAMAELNAARAAALRELLGED
jgi:hypothetical protein